MENREYVRPQLRPNVCVWYIVGLFGACVLCDFIKAKYIDTSRIAGRGWQRVAEGERGWKGLVGADGAWSTDIDRENTRPELTIVRFSIGWRGSARVPFKWM